MMGPQERAKLEHQGWVTVAFPEEFHEGHLCKGVLESAGIEAILTDWDGMVVYEGSEPLMGPYRVQVRELDAERARLLLEKAGGGS